MAKTSKICHVCGKEFSYCSSCNYSEPAYKQLVCSENCHQIWTILSRNGVGLATAQETIDALSKIQMPSNIQSNVQSHIDRLKSEIKPVVEQKKVQPVETSIIVEKSQEETPVNTYLKKKKVAARVEPSQE